ncbi:MAG TPA: class I SAM-dependent methyltransferase [Acidimicrobiia bacterium]|nr:class I SAM-dependent methyltransferase [Acidimicrobiia bacterium]
MTGSDPGAHDAWERNAQWWIDGFTDGADPEYTEQILPLARQWLAGAAHVLDIGTGDGQIARLVRADGAERVVGVDPTAAQLRAARERGGGVHYVRGSAEHVPARDASFDAVVACLVFEHLPDHVEPIREVARVLRPGGRFVFFLNHPLLQSPGSGWIDDHILEEQYWRVGAYLTVDVSMETLAPGVVLPFVHRPLSQYVNTMAECGLTLDRMEEPAPPAGFLARASEYAEAATIPRLLLLVATRH